MNVPFHGPRNYPRSAPGAPNGTERERAVLPERGVYGVEIASKPDLELLIKNDSGYSPCPSVCTLVYVSVGQCTLVYVSVR